MRLKYQKLLDTVEEEARNLGRWKFSISFVRDFHFHLYHVPRKDPQGHSVNQEIKYVLGFPGGSVVKNLPASAGDTGMCV